MTITVPATVFIGGVTSALTAAQYSEIRPEISGVYVRCESDQVVFVGTDGFRLAEQTIAGSFTSFKTDTAKRDFIIPIRVAEEVVKVLSSGDESITIRVDENQIFFERGDIKITSRLMDGKFPEYRAIVPKSSLTRAIVHRSEFIQAVRLVSSLTGKTNDLTVTIDEKTKTLTLSASDSGRGENTCSIPCRITGESCLFVVNWKYLMDGIKLYESEDVILTTTERPVSITSQSEHGTLYLLMPIQS
jgi:DNA polymerase-3 subunit beta